MVKISHFLFSFFYVNHIMKIIYLDKYIFEKFFSVILE